MIIKDGEYADIPTPARPMRLHLLSKSRFPSCRIPPQPRFENYAAEAGTSSRSRSLIGAELIVRIHLRPPVSRTRNIAASEGCPLGQRPPPTDVA